MLEMEKTVVILFVRLGFQILRGIESIHDVGFLHRQSININEEEEENISDESSLTMVYGLMMIIIITTTLMTNLMLSPPEM